MILISDYKDNELEKYADHYVYLNEVDGSSNYKGTDDAFLMFPYLYNAQLFSLYTSKHFGYSPDNPCPSGSVNRVVQGVTIHPYMDK